MHDVAAFKKACKELTELSVPLVGFRIIIYVNIFLSMLMVASLGHLELAASAYITPIQVTINISGWSIIFALPIIVGHVFGEGKIFELHKILKKGWLISLMVSRMEKGLPGSTKPSSSTVAKCSRSASSRACPGTCPCTACGRRTTPGTPAKAT